MSAMLIATIALFGAGYVFDWLRAKAGVSPATRRRSRFANRMKVVLAVVAIAFPVITLMLAKLFASDLLGWIFGLTLMAGAATLPCAVIFYAGMKLHSGLGGPRIEPMDQRPATAPVASPTMVVQIYRGSVHASDDASSARIEVHADTAVRLMLEEAIAAAELPTISGGKATWLVEVSDGTGECPASPIAVCAQQWPEPAWLIPERSPMAALVSGRVATLKFRYGGQSDPALLFERLRRPN